MRYDAKAARSVGLILMELIGCIWPAMAVCQQAVLSTAEIASRVRPSVVTVLTFDGEGEELGSGSGFVVREYGWIATCLHVVEEAHVVRVLFSDGRELTVFGVMHADTETDLAVLAVPATELPAAPLGDDEGLRPGDPIVVLGSPEGLYGTVSDGIIGAVREEGGIRSIQISAPISEGSSGGPVLDKDGRVVGVAAASMESGQNLNFAVPIRYLKELLESDPDPILVSELAVRRQQSWGDNLSSPAYDEDLSSLVTADLDLLNMVRQPGTILGEEVSDWATAPRHTDTTSAMSQPAFSTSDLEGQWEIREFTKNPEVYSYRYRGVFVSTGEQLRGRFYYREAIDDWVGPFETDEIVDMRGWITSESVVRLEGAAGCVYAMYAGLDVMSGYYFCVNDSDTIYDMGEAEGFRIDGPGPSGVYRCRMRVSNVENDVESTIAAGVGIYASESGAWFGLQSMGAQAGEDPPHEFFDLDSGSWTSGGQLQGLLGDQFAASGSFDSETMSLSVRATDQSVTYDISLEDCRRR